jgi:outer membrane murein-binding lipoprotein Lpp
MKTKIGASVLAALVVAGCASSGKDVTATYVSPVMYQHFTCDQLSMEAQRISHRAAEMTGQQDRKATGDKVATGVGLILFWPSLFFIKGDGATAAELARLKGEMDAIEQTSIQKNCGIQFQKAPPQKPKVASAEKVS